MNGIPDLTVLTLCNELARPAWGIAARCHLSCCPGPSPAA
jgi:hypothetical protein